MTLRRWAEFAYNRSKTNNHYTGETSVVAALLASTILNQSWMQPLSAAGGRAISFQGVNGTSGAGSAQFNLSTAYYGADEVLGVVSGTDAMDVFIDTGGAYKGSTVMDAGVIKVYDSGDILCGTGAVTYATSDIIRRQLIVKTGTATTTLTIYKQVGSAWVLSETINVSSGNWGASPLARVDRGLYTGFALVVPTDTNTYNAGNSVMDDAAFIDNRYKCALQLYSSVGTTHDAGFVAGPLGTIDLNMQSLDCLNNVNTGYMKHLTTSVTQAYEGNMTACGIPAGSSFLGMRYLTPFVFTGTAAWTVAQSITINGSTYATSTTSAAAIVAGGVNPAGAGWFHGRGQITDGAVLTLAGTALTAAMLDAATVKIALVSNGSANELRVDTFQIQTLYVPPSITPGVNPYAAPYGNSIARLGRR